MRGEDRLRAQRRRRGRREEGIALFAVVMAMTILYLLVFQIHYVSKMEEGISKNRRSYLDMSYAMASAARWAIAQIQDDLAKDVEESGGTPVVLGGGRIGEGGAGGAGVPALDAAGRLAPGANIPGGGGGTIDSLGEPLFYPADKSLNGVKVRVKVADGESRLSLNHLFEYAAILEAVQLSEKEERKIGAAVQELVGAAGEEEERAVNDLLRRPWEPPDQAKVDATIAMLERLIQGVVEWNEQQGFTYIGTYNPTIIANEIARYVLERKTRPGDSFIYDVSELLDLAEVTTELFHGPSKERIIDGRSGLLLDEFGDVTFDPAAWGLETPESLQGLIAQEFAGMPGFEGYDVSYLTMRYGSQLGYLTQYPENPDGTGILRPPEPIGLRHIFTAFSSGKINLNTAHPAVLFGLLRDLELDEAWQVVGAIDEYRNAYKQEEGGEGTAVGDALAQAKTAEDVTRALGGQGLAEEAFAAGGLDLNVFTGNWKVEIQGIGDGEFLKPSGARAIDASKETDLYQGVVNCLDPVATTRSEYFLVEVIGKKENVTRAGELVVRRDYKGKRIRVVLWRDRIR